ncbi:membrane protein [Streptomyces longispororuber]|uniref:Membrane protein n=1 Tax=Streptomyces longispororuber TaxID=68230 RepID=A0A919ABJ6_9ACTN|nr:anthrone oxygenase family protein [Streptomyces longispororuber]GHE98385.1 membrane protein [Streptomyces longispororuber]
MTTDNTPRPAPAAPRGPRPGGPALGAAVLTTGLTAGAFFVFACAVMPGLGRGSDRAYIEVMQHINEVIQNPVFLAAFLGAPLSTAYAAWRLRRVPAGRWVLAAFVAYGAAFTLTAGVHVPLNDALAAAGDPAVIADPAAVRADFEGPWVAWNAVRAVLCTLAFGLLCRALVAYGAPAAQPVDGVAAAGSNARR